MHREGGYSTGGLVTPQIDDVDVPKAERAKVADTSFERQAVKGQVRQIQQERAEIDNMTAWGLAASDIEAAVLHEQAQDTMRS